MYSFKARVGFNTYSRQIPEKQRPVIVSYNPEEISKIDRKSYTKYLKHKSSKDSREHEKVHIKAGSNDLESAASLQEEE